MTSSRSSSSSPEPEPEIVSKKSQKSKDKKKQKVAHAPAEVEGNVRNEVDNPEWDYKPPEGFVLMKHKVDETEFDWDAINNDDNLELWVVRVPEGLKPKYLDGVNIETTTSSRTAHLGSIDRKHEVYDIWSLGDDVTDAVGGEELRCVSCLLPRRRNDGKLYQARKTFARRLVISARPGLPTPIQSPSVSTATLHQNPPRTSYPKELLKHRFMPLGSLAPVEDSDSPGMDVDMEGAQTTSARTAQSSTTQKSFGGADGGKKKRKGDVELPKKAKKAKGAT